MAPDANDTASVTHWARPGALLLAGASLALLLSIATASVERIGEPLAGFLFWDNGVLVSLHDESWTGARAGLPLNGGIIVGIDGQPFTSGRQLMRSIADAPIGTTFSYEVLADGVRRSIPVPTMRFGATDFAVTFGVYLLNGTALLFTGVLMLFLRFDAPAPRALALSTTVLGALLLLAVDFMSDYRWIAACRFAEALAPAALVNVAMVFPTPWPSKRLRFAITGAVAAASLGAGAVASLNFYSDPELARAIVAALYLAIACALLALVGNYGYSLLYAPNFRRRMQAAVVFAGGFPAFAMAALGMLAFTLLGWSFSWSWVFALLPLAPLSMLYALVRQDIFDAERFVRLSIGYTLASASVVGLYAGSLALADWLVIGSISENPAASLFLLLTVALVFDPVRRRVQIGIDRLFYRSKMDAARELEEASEAFARLSDESAIIDALATRLERALGVADARLVTEPELHEAALVQPLRFAGELLGVLVCGPKRNGAPLSASERDFAKGLADQAALAIQHARALDALRETRDALHRKERLAEVGEFAGAIAHGIRNPLAGIRAAAQHALSAGVEQDMQRSLQTVIDESGRLEFRVRGLLDFARPFSLDRVPIDLRELTTVVTRDAAPFAQEPGVHIRGELPDSPVRVNADFESLREVLLELVTNGLRMMPDGGELTITVTTEDDSCLIAVEDTGPGIPPSHYEHIFDLFYTTRRDGTGIGLASARRVISAHGGSIRAGSAPGGGARFEVRVPLIQPPTGAPAVPPRAD